MNSQQLIVMAAVFGGTNMGQPLPEKKRIQHLLAPNCSDITLSQAVDSIWGQLLETDEQYQWFVEEAEGWIESLETNTDEEILRIWPHIYNLVMT